jgi:hypothetical protein
MRVIHWDKKRKFYADLVLPDWRKWAQENHYILVETLPLTRGNMQILFEIYRHPDPNSLDAYLLYHPPIGATTNTEILCILPNKSVFEQVLQAEQQMALSVIKLMQEKSEE